MGKLLLSKESDAVPRTETAARPTLKDVPVVLMVPLGTAIATYMGHTILIWFGKISDFLRKVGVVKVSSSVERNHQNYVPLFHGFEHFYKCNMYRRIRDCANRPICSLPGPEITLMDRVTHDHGWTFEFTGTTSKAINMSSYNYLSFAENKGPCAEAAEEVTRTYACATAASRMELGTLDIHHELESLVSRFLGVEDALTFGMGFATNALNLPTLMDHNCLILSDELNHASIILGSRLSGAIIRVFKHNDMRDLEQKLRDAIVYGHPRTRRLWKKILVVVEGVYSMEGTIVNLPKIVHLKIKYKAYLYLDEAHSVGALGPNGRGVVDYWGCDPLDIDIMMGTFTKSFAAAGGYIAGSRKLINHLRATSHAAYYAASMSAPVARQIISTMRIIMGQDGTIEGQKRIVQLASNTRYFRQNLRALGFIIVGDDDSPVVPLLQFMLPKMAIFSRMALEQGVAVVSVSFPMTPINACRVRFCMSAAHTKEMLDKTLAVCDQIGNAIRLKYFIHSLPKDSNIHEED